MTPKRNALSKLPGWLGIGIITALNTLWLVWGIGASFYECWGVEGTPWLLFFVIGAAAMLFSALALRWPWVGGGVLIAAGVGFALWWLIPGLTSGFYSANIALERLLLSGGFALVGVLLILDARFNPKPDKDLRPWILRKLR